MAVKKTKCDHIIDEETYSDYTGNIPTDYGRWDADGWSLCPYCMKPVKDIVLEQYNEIYDLKKMLRAEKRKNKS